MTRDNRAEWQPIKSAPKDGSRVLVFGPIEGPKYNAAAMRWGRGVVGEPQVSIACWKGGRWQTGAYQVPKAPTHWMPLPLPPSHQEIK